MTPQQFAVIAKVLRSGDSASSRAARMVLIEGAEPGIAAAECGITPQAVSQSVKRYQSTWDDIDAAWHDE